LTNVEAVTLSSSHALGLVTGGHVYCWGANNAAGDHFLPTTVVSANGAPITNQAVLDAQTITGNTPAQPVPGTFDVSASTTAGTTTLPGAMVYDHAVANMIGVAQVGGSFEVRLASYPSKPLIFLGDTVPGPYPIGVYGYAGVGFSPQLAVVLDYFGAFTGVPNPNAILDPTGQWSVTVNVPNIPAIAGQTIYGQAYAFSFNPFPPNTLFFPTNVLTVTLLP
jgi:hypothetical protein